MPIKNRSEKKKETIEKIDNIQFLSLVNRIKRFFIVRLPGTQDEYLAYNVIDIDITEKKIMVTHPDYELFSYEQKTAVNLLISKYKFYIQWKIFTI